MANDFNITSEGQLVGYTGNGKDVVIPDGVKSIGDFAFSCCNSLKSVVIPESVTSIGEEAFSDCENLTSVIIPESVTSIGGGAFLDTPWLNKQQGIIQVGKVVIAYQGIGKEIVIPEGVTSIGEWAFCDCDNLQRVTISEGVTNIGNGAFSGCTCLTDVSIPEGVTSIGASSFCDCSSLVTVTIPESVTSIGSYAFSGCSVLMNIAIPDSVNYIGVNAFYKTPWLNTKEGIVKAGKVVIAYQGIEKEIVIPEGVTSFGERAFCDCNNLHRVTIPEGVTSIGECAFSDCKYLTDVSIPEGVTSIGQYTFSGCDNLQNVIIPESVTSIGECAFSGCKCLTDVSIPEGVMSIGQYAFSGCDNLQNVIIPDGMKRIEKYAFRNCISLRSLTIPESVTCIRESAFSGCSRLTSVTIPNGVTCIGDKAFSDCRSLNSIIISDGVTSIGRGAFSCCYSLTSIAIPDSVTNVGEGVFSGCDSLENITFLGSKCKLGKEPFGSVLHSGGIPNGLKDKIFGLIPRLTDGTLKEYILETYLWGTLTAVQQEEVFLSRQSKTLTSGYMKCITDDRLESFENAFEVCLRKKPSAKECAAVALYMTWFKEKIPARRLQKLYSLLKPVKSAEKALAIIDDDLVLKEKLGMELKADENLAPAERIVMERLVSEKKSQKDLENQLKELYGITFADLPSILDKERNKIEPYVLAWLLQAHERMEEPRWGAKKKITIVYKRNDICEEAKEVLKEVDEESFQVALLELSKRFLAKHVNTINKKCFSGTV